jgi:A/G-specific adenine glycosylase
MEAGPETLARLLLAHFDQYSSDMPWRHTADPYAIWVSEVMLQQTRVETVIPYYNRWLARFPTVDALAEADEEVVLREWEGLGYYSRARNLHAAAKVVREHHDSRIPDTAAGLRDLPGVGAYTAGAVSSIAYGRVEPAIDGNARRVLSRILDLEQPAFPALQRIAAPLVPADRPGDFNQALMELGSRVCTPRRPRCDACPLTSICLALRNGTVALRPGTTPSKKLPAFDVASAVIIADDRVLLVKRPDTGLLAGFWEFPSRIAPKDSASKTARIIARELGVSTRARPRRLEPVRHVFSHRIETYHPVILQAESTTDPVCDVGARWVTRDAASSLPMPVAQRHIARAAGLAVDPAS